MKRTLAKPAKVRKRTPPMRCNQCIGTLPVKDFPAHMPSADMAISAILAPIHTGTAERVVDKPATAIWVLSPNSESKIIKKVVINILWLAF